MYKTTPTFQNRIITQNTPHHSPYFHRHSQQSTFQNPHSGHSNFSSNPCPTPSHNRAIVALDSPGYPSFNSSRAPEHQAMSSQQPKRLTRRLLKLASLGLAGLLAGLLTGCSASPTTFDTASYTHSTNLPITQPARSLESTRIPEIKRPPVPHHMQSWPSRAGQNPPVVATDIESGHTLAAYTFTGTAPSAKVTRQ